MTDPSFEARPKRSLFGLIGSLPGLISDLIRAELDRLKDELATKAKAAGIGVAIFAAAALFGFFALAVLLAAAVLGIAVALPAWLAALIVGAALLDHHRHPRVRGDEETPGGNAANPRKHHQQREAGRPGADRKREARHTVSVPLETGDTRVAALRAELADTLGAIEDKLSVPKQTRRLKAKAQASYEERPVPVDHRGDGRSDRGRRLGRLGAVWQRLGVFDLPERRGKIEGMTLPAEPATPAPFDPSYTLWAVLRRDPAASLLDSDLAAGVDELDAAVRDVESTGVTLRGFYDVSGLEADADLMIWLHGGAPEALQAALRSLRRTLMLTTLLPDLERDGRAPRRRVHRDHLPVVPARRRGRGAGSPSTRSSARYEWYLLPDDERRGMLAEHGRKGRDYPQVQPNTVAAFALGDYEWILALEADELVDLVDLMRDLRQTDARRHVREEIPFYTGRRIERTSSRRAAEALHVSDPGRCSGPARRTALRRHPARRLRRPGGAGRRHPVPAQRHARPRHPRRAARRGRAPLPRTSAASARSTRRTATLKAALEAELAGRGIELPVYWGNRNWAPFLDEALQRCGAAGHTTLSPSPRARTARTPAAGSTARTSRGALADTGLGGRVHDRQGAPVLRPPRLRRSRSSRGAGARAPARALRGFAASDDPRPVLDPLDPARSTPTRSGPAERGFGAGGAYAAQHLAVAVR